MKWTPTLCKRSLAFGWRRLWDGKRVKYPDYPARVPQVFAKKGVEVVDTAATPEQEEWQPPVDDPRFHQPPERSEICNFNQEPAYICTPRVCIHKGVDQAACLAKAQVFQGLPHSVNTILNTVLKPSELTNTLVQRYIMLAQLWNTTREKLPQRFDARKPGWKFQAQYGIPPKKQSEILIRNLLQLCQAHVASYPGLADRRQIYNPYINSHYYCQGEPVVVRGLSHCLVTSSQPLSRFSDEECVDASAQHELPNMFPLLPTIDLLEDHNYTLEHFTGLNPEWRCSHPHTLVITDSNHFSADHRLARDILFCLGYAVAEARQRYGNVSWLPEPVCVQSVSLDHASFNFVAFQLNTLTFDSDRGIKNQVWVDGGNDMYRKVLAQPWMPKPIRHQQLLDYDPSVFRKLLAVYLNGAIV